MNKKVIVVLIIVVVTMIFAAAYIAIFSSNIPPELQELTYDDYMKGTVGVAAQVRCEELCKQRLNESQDLSSGPCLSNEIVADWVCDVAHNPRSQTDNLSENQCSAYGRTAHHFVEVDENCNLIRVA